MAVAHIAMRSIYTVPFRSKVAIEDHWPVPLMGGICRVIEKDGLAEALEITFTKEPVTNAPGLTKLIEGEAQAQITHRDNRLLFLKRHLDDAIAFLECFHNIKLATDEITARYEAETPAEHGKILIHSFTTGRREQVIPLSYDMLTRALMAAETKEGPHFETKLLTSAREHLTEQRYINSFRYSFLLAEAVFGEGQFKTKALQDAFKKKPAFVAMVAAALADPIPARYDKTSPTAELLANKPPPEAVIDHLVEMRGFYFHGNRKRKDAWSAAEQQKAEALALLAVGIGQEIVKEASDPIFEEKLAARHFENAMKAGAEIVYEITFKFKEPDEPFVRDGAMEIRAPGTKVTPRGANEIAREFLNRFQYGAPVAAIQSASCAVKGSGQKVFDITFHKAAAETGAPAA